MNEDLVGAWPSVLTPVSQVDINYTVCFPPSEQPCLSSLHMGI